MKRNWVLEKLENYQGINNEDELNKKKLIEFIKSNERCFESLHPPHLGGHITGSSWLVNADQSKVLLTHHRKLDKWFQLGGHSDGHHHVLETALREAVEESGIKSIVAVNEDIFDIDIHEIPGKKGTLGHLHYDIRFLLMAKEEELPIVSEESHDLKWVSLDEVKNYNSDESMLRMCLKWKSPLNSLK